MLVDDPVLVGACDAAANEMGVASAVLKDDFIFNHFVLHAGLGAELSAREYFVSGRRSARQVADIARSLNLPENASILEFASGYGCVTRHLPAVFPDAHIVANDISEDMMAFLKVHIGVETMISNVVPERLAADQTFDLVFALSFFSHMPRSTFMRWLAALLSVTKPGGLLLFTTHGAKSSPVVNAPVLGRGGYWYEPRHEHPMLDGATYGMTITSYDFCAARIARLPGAEIVYYKEGLWWGHQDTYVVRRSPEPTDLRPRPFLLDTILPDIGIRRAFREQVQTASRSVTHFVRRIPRIPGALVRRARRVLGR